MECEVGSEIRDTHSVISLAKAYKASAVMVMKTIIEPNKAAVSLIKLPAVIFGGFVAL